MTELPEKSDVGFRDEAYPDGLAWRCAEGDCDFATGDDDERCPRHPDAYMFRVNRRITWGPLPSESRDVVVENR